MSYLGIVYDVPHDLPDVSLSPLSPALSRFVPLGAPLADNRSDASKVTP
ncbi:MAG TPA: hypothetical protein VHG10_04440 [Glycomyces sp.]|nr:hypothetical protein [Glycomyces sp.]